MWQWISIGGRRATTFERANRVENLALSYVISIQLWVVMHGHLGRFRFGSMFSSKIIIFEHFTLESGRVRLRPEWRTCSSDDSWCEHRHLRALCTALRRTGRIRSSSYPIGNHLRLNESQMPRSLSHFRWMIPNVRYYPGLWLYVRQTKSSR